MPQLNNTEIPEVIHDAALQNAAGWFAVADLVTSLSQYNAADRVTVKSFLTAVATALPTT
jgi:hypothetical protein